MRACTGSPARGCRARRGTSRRSSGSARPAAPARGPPRAPRPRSWRAGAGTGSRRRATVFTHRRPAETSPALRQLLEAAREAGVTLRFDREETRKHELSPGPAWCWTRRSRRCRDLLRARRRRHDAATALRATPGTGVPVFGVNFGEIGFLATVEPEISRTGFRARAGRRLRAAALPAIVLSVARRARDGDQRRRDPPPGRRARAELAYSLGRREAGACAATAWWWRRRRVDRLQPRQRRARDGVGRGRVVVSFIAPHSMSARALVAAPDDRLTIYNRSLEPLDVAVDGRPAGEIPPAGGSRRASPTTSARSRSSRARRSLCRLREKFGRLAS